MRPEINIYIETSSKGPAIRKGAYIYTLEYFTTKKPEARTGFEYQMQTTENRLVLSGLVTAIKRITKPAYIRVFTGCRHVSGAMENGWAAKWQQAGWINAKGLPVRNADLWSELLRCLEPHVITFSSQTHPHQIWMEKEVEKISRNN